MIFLICLIRFRNRVIQKKEKISKSKRIVEIAKQKYDEVLNKVLAAQKESLEKQKDAYSEPKTRNEKGLFGGMFGSLDSSLGQLSRLISKLADDYEKAMQEHNKLVEDYNIYISTFPKSILRVILRYKKADYIE